MKNLVWPLIMCFVCGLTGCKRVAKKHFEYNITKHIYYAHLSSASGITLQDSTLVVVGDDLPWMVQLNPNFATDMYTQISGIDSVKNDRTPSRLKADYECMESFTDDSVTKILILSSGSKKDTRDTAVLLTKKGRYYIRKQNIRPVYDMIKDKAGLKNVEINIEGLAISKDMIYLFHRGNISKNFIATIPKNEFIRYIETGNMEFSELNIYPFNLPSNDGIQSGFSGACMIPEQDSILFTASLENTKTATGDGEITGSYIGIIAINDLQSGKYDAQLFKWDGKIVVKKLEGICVRGKAGNELDVVTVSDNDDGTSDLYQFKLKI
jgi:Family of unknown function (DUF6929)